jgi:hypothetical protein
LLSQEYPRDNTMHRTLTKMALKENFKLSLRWGVVAREKPRKAMKGKERKASNQLISRYEVKRPCMLFIEIEQSQRRHGVASHWA